MGRGCGHGFNLIVAFVIMFWGGYIEIALSERLSKFLTSANTALNKCTDTDETLYSCSNYDLRMNIKADNPDRNYFKGDQ